MFFIDSLLNTYHCTYMIKDLSKDKLVRGSYENVYY